MELVSNLKFKVSNDDFENYNRFIGAYNKLFVRHSVSKALKIHKGSISSIRSSHITCTQKAFNTIKLALDSAGFTVRSFKHIDGSSVTYINGTPVTIDDTVDFANVTINVTVADHGKDI